jgi:hypothetical protein
MRTRKPWVRRRLTTEGWKVRLVAMILLFPAKPRAAGTRRGVVAAEAARSGPSMLRHDGIPGAARWPARHPARRPIGEKPRIRRDKPPARQTGLPPARPPRSICDAPSCPPFLHKLFSITRKCSPRHSSPALRVSARYRATLLSAQ